MLNKIDKYFSLGKKVLFDQLYRTKFYSSTSGLCCISIHPQEFTFVYASQIGGKTNITVCESHPYKNVKSLASTLTLIIKNKGLKNAACSLMLQPDDYQLLVVDVLPVAETEFQAAIRWKIKDLIRFPLNDVVIDSFVLPKMKTGQDKMMVIVAQASKLEIMRQEISQCSLNLKFIDVFELGLRNIAVLYEQDEKIAVLIYVQENSTQLLITYKQQIYVSRQLKFSLNTDDADTIAQSIDRLAAETQRSFDYFQSLWGQPPPSIFIFAATKLIGSEATDLLSQRLKAPIQIINIMDTLKCELKISPDEEGKYLPVIGGALRESKKNVTGN